MSEQNLNEQNVQQPAEDIDALRQVRLDKLSEMQESGKDPFRITKFDVTASTAECRSMYENLVLHLLISGYALYKLQQQRHILPFCLAYLYISLHTIPKFRSTLI